jgi:hypothetical protein
MGHKIINNDKLIEYLNDNDIDYKLIEVEGSVIVDLDIGRPIDLHWSNIKTIIDED